MVEQETGAVDQRPGQILHDGQPFVLILQGAVFGVFAQLDQAGIEVDGLLGLC